MPQQGSPRMRSHPILRGTNAKPHTPRMQRAQSSAPWQTRHLAHCGEIPGVMVESLTHGSASHMAQPLTDPSTGQCWCFFLSWFNRVLSEAWRECPSMEGVTSQLRFPLTEQLSVGVGQPCCSSFRTALTRNDTTMQKRGPGFQASLLERSKLSCGIA